MANCLCFKDLVLVSESQSDNDYTRFIGGVHPIFCRFLVVWLNVGNPGQTNLCMFIGRIYKPITFLHDPSRRDKSWIAALFSGVFCLRCFLFVLYCFFFHFPTHALLSASWCFFFGGPTNGNFRNLWYHTQAYEQSFPWRCYQLSLHFNHLLVELRVNIPP